MEMDPILKLQLVLVLVLVRSQASQGRLPRPPRRISPLPLPPSTTTQTREVQPASCSREYQVRRVTPYVPPSHFLGKPIGFPYPPLTPTSLPGAPECLHGLQRRHLELLSPGHNHRRESDAARPSPVQWHSFQSGILLLIAVPDLLSPPAQDPNLPPAPPSNTRHLKPYRINLHPIQCPRPAQDALRLDPLHLEP